MRRIVVVVVLAALCGCDLYVDDSEPGPDAEPVDAGMVDACVTVAGRPQCCSDYPPDAAPQGCAE